MLFSVPLFEPLSFPPAGELLADGMDRVVDVPPTVPSNVGVTVAVVKELSLIEDWNTTPEAPSVSLDWGPDCSVCTSAAESVGDCPGTNGVWLGDDVDVVEGTGPAIRTAVDVEDAAVASSAVEDGGDESEG